MLTPEQLKGRIRNLAKEKGLSSQEVLQMYLFEHVLARLARSPYKDNFILKGGFLIASMIGVNERTTMDMDTTVRGITMQKDAIEEIITEILAADLGDGIEFIFDRIAEIREDADYNNFRVFFNARYGKINNPMKMDITTGDEMTPSAIEYSYKTMFEDDAIDIKAYNLPTILAEKYETIIRRNIGNTRARDFYDLYVLYNLNKDALDYDIFAEAVKRTSENRNSLEDMLDAESIIEDISKEDALKELWASYQNEYAFSQNISYGDIIECITEIMERLTLDLRLK